MIVERDFGLLIVITYVVISLDLLIVIMLVEIDLDLLIVPTQKLADFDLSTATMRKLVVTSLHLSIVTAQKLVINLGMKLTVLTSYDVETGSESLPSGP